VDLVASPARPASSWRTEYTSAGRPAVGASNISNYSLFEAAHAAFTAVSDPHDKAEVAAALFKVNIPRRHLPGR
jgi:hypothetical protein